MFYHKHGSVMFLRIKATLNRGTVQYAAHIN